MEYLSSRAAESEVEWIRGFALLYYLPAKPEPARATGYLSGIVPEEQGGRRRVAGRIRMGFAGAFGKRATAPPARGRDLVTLDQSATT